MSVQSYGGRTDWEAGDRMEKFQDRANMDSLGETAFLCCTLL